MYKFFRLSLATLLIFMLSALAAAQSTTTGAVGVTVTDPKGAVVANAAVTVHNTETNKDDTATTDGEGRFQIIDLRPGTYSVTFTLEGFSAFKRDGIELPSNFTATVNADMKVGSLQETVTVSGATKP